MDCRRAWDIVEHFIECGVVAKRERDGGYLTVALEPRYPAYEQLRRLLRALGVEPDGERVKRWGFPKNALPANLKPLFGTPKRTNVLLCLASVGTATLTDIRKIVRASEQTVDRAIRLFVQAGIVSRLDDGGGPRPHTLMLNDRWPAAQELRALLLAVARIRPQYRNVARLKHRESVRRKVETQRRARPADGPEAFMPFVSPAFARTALVLADGPIRIADLQAGLDIGFDSARKTVRRMEVAGLVVTARKWKDLWVSSASGDSLCDAFFVYAMAVAKRSPLHVERSALDAPTFNTSAKRATIPWRPRVLRILRRLDKGAAKESQLFAVTKQHQAESRRILDRLRRLGLITREGTGERSIYSLDAGGLPLRKLLRAA
jgi:DNA-binding IclR family transcriptional regulator